MTVVLLFHFLSDRQQRERERVMGRVGSEVVRGQIYTREEGESEDKHYRGTK